MNRRWWRFGLAGSGTTGAAGGAGANGGACTGASPAGVTGLTVLTSRGGPSTGAAGFGGSGFFAGGAFFAAALHRDRMLGEHVAARQRDPRCRATRSTNERATTSSMVLDALFSSMP